MSKYSGKSGSGTSTYGASKSSPYQSSAKCSVYGCAGKGGLESKMPMTIGKPPVYNLDGNSMSAYGDSNMMAPYIAATMSLANSQNSLVDKLDELIQLYKSMLGMNNSEYGQGIEQMSFDYGNDKSNLAFGDYASKGGYFKHPTSMNGTKLDNDYERKKKNETAKETIMKSDGDLRVFNVNDFISGKTKNIENEDEIMQYIEDAYFETTGYSLPNNISIKLCDESELKRNHFIFNGGEWNRGIQGFCINRGIGQSQVFVKKGNLAETLLTVGHELGHLQTMSLNPIEEEAKAYAFSIEWMKKIKENNIANLSNVLINDNPALNGLHNVAYDFVARLIKEGRTAWDVFNGLIKNTLVAS
ncbi:hypothetical protein KY321_01635 [Candidatus Woesearchaeota archaeon]|nr:hypothetical protein [Candidatus Woesearchaeota archaeon]